MRKASRAGTVSLLHAHHAVHKAWRRHTPTRERCRRHNLWPRGWRHVMLLLYHNRIVLVLVLCTINRKLLLHVKVPLESDACEARIHPNTTAALHLLLGRPTRLFHYLLLLRL